MSVLKSWEENIKTFIKAIENIGGESDGYIIKPPADEIAINKIEEQLGIPLPLSFRNTVKELTSGMEMNWSLPNDKELENPLPHELRELFASNFSWNLKEMVNIEHDRMGWQEEVFPNVEDDYDIVWHNKLGFMEVGNGDYIAFDLSKPNDPPVVYLSHDDGEGHGYVLGNNFIDFMNRWTRIGCVGCEDWQLLPFIDNEISGIQPDSHNARLWREWLGVELSK